MSEWSERTLLRLLVGLPAVRLTAGEEARSLPVILFRALLSPWGMQWTQPDSALHLLLRRDARATGSASPSDG